MNVSLSLLCLTLVVLMVGSIACALSAIAIVKLHCEIRDELKLQTLYLDRIYNANE